MHDSVERVVAPFLAAADAAFGAGYSALLYGSSARGDYIPGRSNINLMLVLDDASPGRLRALASAFAAWRKTAAEPPLLAELEAELASRAVERLVIAGVHSHACVQSTVLDAYARGFEVVIGEDLVGSYDPAHGAQAMRWLDGRAASVQSSAAIRPAAPNR